MIAGLQKNLDQIDRILEKLDKISDRLETEKGVDKGESFCKREIVTSKNKSGTAEKTVISAEQKKQRKLFIRKLLWIV